MARTFRTKLVGTSHKNNDGTDRQTVIRNLAAPGQSLILISEPNNEFDPFAIGAWVNCNGAMHQLGYLDSRLAAEVTRLIAKKGSAAATIQAITGGTPERPTFGVMFEMTKFDPGEKVVQPSIDMHVTINPPVRFVIEPPTPASYSIGYMAGKLFRKLFR